MHVVACFLLLLFVFELASIRCCIMIQLRMDERMDICFACSVAKVTLVNLAEFGGLNRLLRLGRWV